MHVEMKMLKSLSFEQKLQGVILAIICSIVIVTYLFF